jgi:hypothetical protein
MFKNKALNLIVGLALVVMPACVKQDGNGQSRSDKVQNKIENLKAEYSSELQAVSLSNDAAFEKELRSVVEDKPIKFKSSRLVSYTCKLNNDIIWLKKYGNKECLTGVAGLKGSLVTLRDRVCSLDSYKKEKKSSNWKKAGASAVGPGLIVGTCVVAYATLMYSLIGMGFVPGGGSISV